MPAIWTDKLKPYREWLPADGFEANASLGGSFNSPHIADYYQTPWDLGYGRHVKFDHDFIGREALEQLESQPHRRKVWLRWNKEDALSDLRQPVRRRRALQIHGDAQRLLRHPALRQGAGRPLCRPLHLHGLHHNVRGWFSLAMLDADIADGAEVTLVWGEENGGSPRPCGRAPRADRSARHRLLQPPQ
jgi:vanillate/3-O-methylgallate O-demethylase